MRLVFLGLLILGLVSCNEKPEVKVKNVILMIGDGMGPGQVSLLHHFLKNSNFKEAQNTRNAFLHLSKSAPIAISATEPSGNIVVDSACSATQLSLGMASKSEMIGLDANGDPVDSILKKAQKKGLATGLVSDTRMTHATPAAFAANVANRWYEDDIAKGMIETAPDVLFSGGANRFIPQGETRELKSFSVKSRRKDNLDLLKIASDKGFQLAFEKNDLNNLNPKQKVLGLFTPHNYPDAIWFKNNRKNPERKIPTLLEMSKTAINHLAKKDKGFFLMIEGGQIDWAAHRNDAGDMLHEMLSFNETLNWVADWVEKHPDTLLVVTADHETGAFGLGYNVHDLPESKRLPGSAFKDLDFRPHFNYGSSQSLMNLYNQKKSLFDIWSEYKKLDGDKKSAKTLSQMMTMETGLEVSEKQAQKVLEDEPNSFKASWHRNLHVEKLPKMEFNREYYYDTPNVRTSLMGQILAARQNVVWGTGGHTATGVHVYSKGPKTWTNKFSGSISHPKIGKQLQEALGL